MEQFVDYYKIIGADRNDPINLIEKRCRETAKKCHPENNSNVTKEQLILMTDAINRFKNPEKRKIYEKEYDEHHVKSEGKVKNTHSQNDFHNQSQTDNYPKQPNNRNIEWLRFGLQQLQGVKDEKERELNKLKKSLERVLDIYSVSEAQQKKDYEKKLRSIDERYYDQYYNELKVKRDNLLQIKNKLSLFSNQKKRKIDLSIVLEQIESIERQRKETIDRVTGYFQVETDRRHTDINEMKNKIKTLEKKVNEINEKMNVLENALNQHKDIDNVDEILKSVKI